MSAKPTMIGGMHCSGHGSQKGWACPECYAALASLLEAERERREKAEVALRSIYFCSTQTGELRDAFIQGICENHFSQYGGQSDG